MGNMFLNNSQLKKNTEQVDQRRFYMNEPNERFGTNQVKSTNSTLFTFIPLNIMRQFKNFPNSSIFSMYCGTSNNTQYFTNQGKAYHPNSTNFHACQQYDRHQKDKKENSRPTQILRENGFQLEIWMNIQVGNIIKILQDQIIPCDVLVLSSNLTDNKCYIQTKNLDGQTHQKVRKSSHSKVNFTRMTPNQLASKKYPIQCEPPNPSLENVRGFMTAEGELVSISIENVLLRGCTLKNCKQAICAVLYVGKETKVILNSAEFVGKKSVLMNQLDKIIVIIFTFIVICTVILALLNLHFESHYSQFTRLFLHSQFIRTAASWGLLISALVPISLLVTTQIIKFIQGKFVHRDRKGFSNEYKTYTKVNNTSINQNLGSIKYILTDKTGTLTKNHMTFRKLFVDGTQYGNKADMSTQQQKRLPRTSSVMFRDSKFFQQLDNLNINNALRVMYLCHDIIINKENIQKEQYQSSSPDQVALVNFAKMSGFQLVDDEDNFIRVLDTKSSHIAKYQKLAFLHFNSDRKRMSVIVRLQNNQIVLYMKGADSIVQKKIKPNTNHFEQTQKFIDQSSMLGLRTLMLASKNLTQDEFSKWNKLYIQAKASIQNRQKKLEAVYQLIQNQLQLVGAVAIEDKLQEQVSETITILKQAGINFIVLTGDKKQTALSIGRSCGLVSPNAKIFSYPQDKIVAQSCKQQKVYLLDASARIESYPVDILQNQTICYRCTPTQKQVITNYIKQADKGLTLAVGDGANDVNMILAAHVGIGIKGKEGTQASRAADISIGQFKFLSLVLLYYGRQWHNKIVNMAAYNFYKNWYQMFVLIFYGYFSYFSCVVIYDMYCRQFFNALFTAAPIVIYAVFDKQYSYEQAKAMPHLYFQKLKQGTWYTIWIYIKNILLSIIFAISSLLIVIYSLETNVIHSDGRIGYMWQSGAVIFFNVIVVVNLRVMIVLCHKVSIAMVVFALGSIMMYWLIYYVQYLTFQQFKLADSIHQEWTTIPIYLLHFIMIFMFLGLEYFYSKFKRFRQQQRNYAKMIKKAQQKQELKFFYK